jgi:hypothetical protein
MICSDNRCVPSDRLRCNPEVHVHACRGASVVYCDGEERAVDCTARGSRLAARGLRCRGLSVGVRSARRFDRAQEENPSQDQREVSGRPRRDSNSFRTGEQVDFWPQFAMSVMG